MPFGDDNYRVLKPKNNA